MSKKVLIIGGVTLAVIAAISSFVFIKPKSKETSDITSGSEQAASAFSDEEATPDVLYEDGSGFSLKHPASITVEDVTPEEEDSPFYTLLDLKRESEGINVAFKDTEYKTVDEMLEKDPNAPKNTSLVGASSMAGIAVSQYAYTFEGKEKLLSVTIDKGILYLIEGPKDNGFWEKTHNLVISTLAFAGSTPQAASAGENVIYEAEEVIE